MTKPSSLRTPTELGAAVRAARLKRGETQATLADRAGVARAWLVRLEQGAAGVELGRVMRVVTSLGLVLTLDEPPTVDHGELAVLYEPGGLFADE